MSKNNNNNNNNGAAVDIMEIFAEFGGGAKTSAADYGVRINKNDVTLNLYATGAQKLHVNKNDVHNLHFANATDAHNAMQKIAKMFNVELVGKNINA